jgi:hypothetical protein
VLSFAFISRKIQKGFGLDLADIIYELSGGKQPKDHIYFNVAHTVDGTWNLDGQAQTDLRTSTLNPSVKKMRLG